MHFLFIAVIAPAVTGSLIGLYEIIFESSGQDFLNQFNKVIFGAIFTPIFGIIFSIPLSFFSLIIFKLLMDWEQNKLLYFCLIGGFSGVAIYSVYYFMDESNDIGVLFILCSIGVAIGYFLSFIWKDGYTKTKVSAT